MSAKSKMRPKKGPSKRKGAQKTTQEKRDVDIMNVSISISCNNISGPTYVADKRQ